MIRMPHIFEPLGTSDPMAPQIVIRPGEQKEYVFEIPEDHPPGFDFYHPHKHGATAVQVVSGLAGAIIVRGAIDEVPEIKAAREIPLAVQDIARRAGLSTGAIYGNFRDKADLLADAIEIGMRAGVLDLERARQAGASAIQLLELMGKNLTVKAGNRQRRLLTEALAAARRDPQAAERVRHVLETSEANMAKVIERARRDGDVACHIATPALARFAMAVALGYHEIEGAGLPAPDGQEWSALMEHVIGSLRAIPTEL